MISSLSQFKGWMFLKIQKIKFVAVLYNTEFWPIFIHLNWDPKWIAFHEVDSEPVSSDSNKAVSLFQSKFLFWLGSIVVYQFWKKISCRTKYFVLRYW